MKTKTEVKIKMKSTKTLLWLEARKQSLYTLMLLVIAALTISLAFSAEGANNQPTEDLDIIMSNGKNQISNSFRTEGLTPMIMPVLALTVAGLIGYFIIFLMSLRTITDNEYGLYQSLRLASIPKTYPLLMRIGYLTGIGIIFYGAICLTLLFHLNSLPFDINGFNKALLLSIWSFGGKYFLPMILTGILTSTLLLSYTKKGSRWLVYIIMIISFSCFFLRIFPNISSWIEGTVFQPSTVNELVINGKNILTQPELFYHEPIIAMILFCVLLFFLSTRVWKEIEI